MRGMILALMLIVGCAERQSARPAVFAGDSFTIQMHDYTEGKNRKARLMVCQGEVCRNPLLKAGGKREYLFDDYYSVYKDGQKNGDKGKRLRTALIWGSLLACLSSVGFYIKSDQTRKVLAGKYEEILSPYVNKAHKIDDEIARLEGKEKLTTNAFYASEIAIVSTALASIVTANMSNEASSLQQKLADLLVHKQPVHVTRGELKNILTHLIEIVPASVDYFTKENVMKS